MEVEDRVNGKGVVVGAGSRQRCLVRLRKDMEIKAMKNVKEVAVCLICKNPIAEFRTLGVIVENNGRCRTDLVWMAESKTSADLGLRFRFRYIINHDNNLPCLIISCCAPSSQT